MTGEDLSHLAGGEIIPDAPTAEDMAVMAGDFLQLIALQQDIPSDFAGCAMSIQVAPGTHKLLAVVLSPVDVIDGKYVVRDAKMNTKVDEALDLKKISPLCKND